MADATEMTKAEAIDKLQRVKAFAKNVKAEAQGMAQRGVDAAMTYAGAGAAGAMRGKWGEGSDRHVFFPGTEIEVDAALGAVGTALGVFGTFGSMSGTITATASGMGGYAFGRTMEDKVAAAVAKDKAKHHASK